MPSLERPLGQRDGEYRDGKEAELFVAEQRRPCDSTTENEWADKFKTRLWK